MSYRHPFHHCILLSPYIVGLSVGTFCRPFRNEEVGGGVGLIVILIFCFVDLNEVADSSIIGIGDLEFYDAGETRRPDSLAVINEEECPLSGETIELALPWHLEPDCSGG